MKFDAIIDVITTLSYSQGFYGRLLDRLMELAVEEPEIFETIRDEWETKNFKDAVDFVIYIEG